MLGPKKTYGARPIQPYFEFGDYFFVNSQKDLEQQSKAPAKAGYTFADDVYVWDAEEPVDSSSVGDFVFDHYLSRHTAEDVRDIEKNQSRIFVIGGSVAVGSSASAKCKTWHFILQEKMGSSLSDAGTTRKPKELVSAAMGGYSSTQEKLILALAVLSKNPSEVWFLNGANDVLIPLFHGSRPGDPYTVNSTMKTWYGRPVRPGHLSKAAEARIELNRSRLISDQRIRQNAISSIAKVYCENMKFAFDLCSSAKVPIKIFLQPFQDTARATHGLAPKAFEQSEFEFIQETYGRIREAMLCDQDGLASCFYDISAGHSDIAFLDTFTDFVHCDDKGQEFLADLILNRISAR